MLVSRPPPCLAGPAGGCFFVLRASRPADTAAPLWSRRWARVRRFRAFGREGRRLASRGGSGSARAFGRSNSRLLMPRGPSSVAAEYVIHSSAPLLAAYAMAPFRGGPLVKITTRPDLDASLRCSAKARMRRSDPRTLMAMCRSITSGVISKSPPPGSYVWAMTSPESGPVFFWAAWRSRMGSDGLPRSH